jgi:acyl-homoserine lactone acylase PvdQ
MISPGEIRQLIKDEKIEELIQILRSDDIEINLQDTAGFFADDLQAYIKGEFVNIDQITDEFLNQRAVMYETTLPGAKEISSKILKDEKNSERTKRGAETRREMAAERNRLIISLQADIPSKWSATRKGEYIHKHWAEKIGNKYNIISADRIARIIRKIKNKK